jgi:hypothetical protein
MSSKNLDMDRAAQCNALLLLISDRSLDEQDVQEAGQKTQKVHLAAYSAHLGQTTGSNPSRCTYQHESWLGDATVTPQVILPCLPMLIMTTQGAAGVWLRLCLLNWPQCSEVTNAVLTASNLVHRFTLRDPPAGASHWVCERHRLLSDAVEQRVQAAQHIACARACFGAPRPAALHQAPVRGQAQQVEGACGAAAERGEQLAPPG